MSSNGNDNTRAFGIAEDQPVVADYDGDGKDDIAIYRPSVSEWWILNSASGVFAVQFGQTGDRTVQGDYTGDGKADIAIWRESNGFWYILRSEDNSFFAFPFGQADDVPVPGDYDGDGKFDACRVPTVEFGLVFAKINRRSFGSAIRHRGRSADSQCFCQTVIEVFNGIKSTIDCLILTVHL